MRLPYWIGGLVGAFDGTQGIKECSVSGNINEASGKGSIGGLIGELGEASEISYSRADVSLDVEANARGGADVGGFIGKGNGNKNEETVIKNCYATGNVTGGSVYRRLCRKSLGAEYQKLLCYRKCDTGSCFHGIFCWNRCFSRVWIWFC